MSAGLRRTVLLVAGLAALVAIAAFAKRSEVYLLTLTMVYLMATFGLNLTVGYAGQMSLGQAAFFGIGAYVAALSALQWDWTGNLTLPAAVGAALLVAALVAVPVLRLSTHYFALATLGIAPVSYTHLTLPTKRIV